MRWKYTSCVRMILDGNFWTEVLYVTLIRLDGFSCWNKKKPDISSLNKRQFIIPHNQRSGFILRLEHGTWGCSRLCVQTWQKGGVLLHLILGSDKFLLKSALVYVMYHWPELCLLLSQSLAGGWNYQNWLRWSGIYPREWDLLPLNDTG